MKAAPRWAVFEDHGEIRVMPGIRAKSLTKKTDHCQVRKIKQGGRAKSHWTVKVDKNTASFTSKRKAEEAAAALRADLAAGSRRPRAPRTELWRRHRRRRVHRHQTHGLVNRRRRLQHQTHRLWHRRL